MTSSALTRRRLLHDGAAGTAALYLASQWEILDSAALGAPLTPAVQRSTWTALIGSVVSVSGRSLTVTEVADLPIAASIQGLRGHDGAFVVRFTGPAGLPAASSHVRVDGRVDADLFIAPVEGSSTPQQYEAVVDRTIRIAGINEEGSPIPAEPAAVRVAETPGPSPTGLRPTLTPRLASATLRRGSAGRRATAELVLASTRDIMSVRVSLLSGRTAIARASVQQHSPHRLALRLMSGTALRAGRYRLVVRLTARDGSVTTIRRSVKLR